MILILSGSTGFYLGGVEIFNEELELLLKEEGIKFIRIASITNLKIIDYPYRILLSLLHILFHFKKIKFVLVQYGNFLDILALPLLKFSMKPIRVIAHVGKSWKHIRNKTTRNLTNLILRTCTKMVYIITNEQTSFLKLEQLKRVHTIINEKYKTLELMSDNQEKYLLFLGRICPEKGIEDLIDVYSKLYGKIKLPELRLVGPANNEYKNHITEIINRNNIQEQIKIYDPIFKLDKKIQCIDNAMLLIYPSYFDAFPLIVLESFSRRKCILATSIAETENFIEFKEFLFQPGDRIEMLSKLKFLILNLNKLNGSIDLMHNKALKYTEGVIVNEILE